MRLWLDPLEVTIPEDLLAAAGGAALVARVLAQRGVLRPEEAKAFLDPDCYFPSSPFELPGMERVVSRLVEAIRKQESICVWGDFDVDGQTATTVLVATLRRLGAQVTYHIPLRERESHGVNLPVLKEVIRQGAQLILTCDTGITAHPAAEYARSQGIDFIVTDHHDLPSALPEGYAVVNPKLLPGDHPLFNLPGVGVAYQLAGALYESQGRSGEVEQHLDLTALGIVADLASLRGETRYLLQRGLASLRATARLGLKVLMEIAEIDPAGLTEEHIAFALGPRLNALGRLADANLAVEFLTTADLGRARVLATQLEGMNAQRQLLTEQVFQGALAQIERDPSLLGEAALVLTHPAWPAGVIGIVASRLVERYNRPVVLIAAPPGETARGSARSVEGCNITAAIAEHGELLDGFGGHPMAAGLAIQTERIPEFRRRLSQTVAARLGREPLPGSLTIDLYLPLGEASLELVAQLEQLAPFGPGNPPLIFACRDLRLKSHTPIGRRGEHLQIIVQDLAGDEYRVIWWGGGGWPFPDDLVNGARFDLAYTLRGSDYRGQREVQLEWVDARPIKEWAIEVRNERSALTVQDLRGQAHPLAVLKEILNQPDVLVWAEAGARNNLSGLGIYTLDRTELRPASGLVIWTAPPGPVELRAVLEVVAPQTVYVFGIAPEANTLETFLGHLSGLVKYALRASQGQVKLSALAAATAQRPVVVRAGIAWLVTRGHLKVLSEAEGELNLEEGNGEIGADLSRITGQLKVFFNEAAAYRAHFARAEASSLITPLEDDD